MRDQSLHNVLVDFDRLDEYPELFEVDAIICCLGTTIKQAGSRARFRQVDYQYCLDAAELGRAHSAKTFSLVSAIGAYERSP
ncbi:MAG TPA: nucleoside-diphosphate sugar epimerase, partial [Gammaproteobacteria bacterium]|nr:nucleoside-diphosphate sugar epimerase [Gammaproteobacteria bacterium]